MLINLKTHRLKHASSLSHKRYPWVDLRFSEKGRMGGVKLQKEIAEYKI